MIDSYCKVCYYSICICQRNKCIDHERRIINWVESIFVVISIQVIYHGKPALKVAEAIKKKDFSLRFDLRILVF